MDKTVFVNFKTSSVKQIINVGDITTSNKVKFLGLYLDSVLNYELHTNYICIKLNKSYSAVETLKINFDMKTLVNVYALVYTHLKNCGVPVLIVKRCL
jgi:hypothetical protein